MKMLQTARRAKHLAYVMNKRSSRRAKAAKFDIATRVFRNVERVRPFAYDARRYERTFLASDVVPVQPSALPRHVFVIWAGRNPLTENRQRNLDAIKSSIDLPVELVTPDSLGDWLVDGSPLHPAFEHLSMIHRSDYLRGYLMHHHGGAYVDVKQPLHSWAAPFEAFRDDEEAWVTSYAAEHANWIGKLKGPLGRDILLHYRLMFGKGAFMMRSYTPLTAEWLSEMDRRLDNAQDRLLRHPGGIYGDDEQYPLSWTDLLGRVLDPLTLKHLNHVRYDDRLLLRFKDYR